jgi:hypothetical protein
MKKVPETGEFLDQDEMDIFKAIESANFDPVSNLTTERRAELQKMAKQYQRETNLERLKV